MSINRADDLNFASRTLSTVIIKQKQFPQVVECMETSDPSQPNIYDLSHVVPWLLSWPRGDILASGTITFQALNLLEQH